MIIRSLKVEIDKILEKRFDVYTAIFISFLFFVSSDYLFPIPDINGKWEFESYFQKSRVNQGNTIKFEALVLQAGSTIQGSAEKNGWKNGKSKDWDNFNIDDRSQIELMGYITKKYLSKSTLVIHYVEKTADNKFEIKTVQFLKIIDSTHMKGTFVTDKDDNRGTVMWTKEVSE